MKKVLLIIFSLCFLFSCQNSEGENYIQNENKAINDLILNFIKFKEITKLNNNEGRKLKLYISNKLNIATAYTIKPTGYDIAEDGVYYSKERIEENKKRFENELEKYELEEELFSKLKEGKIKERDLDFKFHNDEIEISYIDFKKINDFNPKKGEYGYLRISRIIFNWNYSVGYLHYEFLCGDLCAWDDNIKIKKINGKWKITDYYSGGVS